MNKISGNIINFDSSFYGTIQFDKKIHSVNKINNQNSKNIIIPGFIDLHCHGGNGFDTMGGLSSIEKMSKYHLKNGTTSILPTTLTASFNDTLRALKGTRKFVNSNKNITNIIGFHLEGPFINSKKLGAQPPHAILPDINFIEKINLETIIKTITLAPELKGAKNFINYLLKKGINFQIGHSLADYECCYKVMERKDISFTHLYNAMSGNDHRNPGVVTAALRHGKFAEIICDLHHVNKQNIHLAYKCISQLYAISDSISATGKSDGEYNFANLKIIKKNNKALINSKTLAGSIINMHDTFKNLIKINFSLEQAVKMTSYNAAQFINENKKGVIDEGYDSNLIVLNSDLEIREVYLYGNLIK